MNLDEVSDTTAQPTIAAVPALGPAFTIDRKAFAAALTRLKNVADHRAYMPILSCVKLTADDSYVTLRATNLAVDVSITLEATVTRPGETCIPCKSLVASVGKGAGTVSIDGDRVRSGAMSSTVRPMPAEDFPPSAGARPTRPIAIVDFKRALKRTTFAISADETRPHLAGLLLERNKGAVRLVATDGHRLALCVVGQDSRADFTGIVPSSVVNELARWKSGPVSVFMSDTAGSTPDDDGTPGIHPRHVWFATAAGVVSGRLVDAAFPAYEQAIPSDGAKSITVDRAATAKVLREVAKSLGNDGPDWCILDATASDLTISSKSDEGADIVATVPCTRVGDAFRIGLNVRYISEALESLDDATVTLQMGSDKLDPMKIVASDGTIIVTMPARI